MKFIKTYTIALLVVLAFTSCRKRDFSFVIENNTHYTLDSIEFASRWGRFSNGYTVEPFAKSNEFDQAISGINFWANDLYLVFVHQFSDSAGIYSSEEILEMDRLDFSRRKVNIIRVSYGGDGIEEKEVQLSFHK